MLARGRVKHVRFGQRDQAADRAAHAVVDFLLAGIGHVEHAVLQNLGRFILVEVDPHAGILLTDAPAEAVERGGLNVGRNARGQLDRDAAIEGQEDHAQNMGDELQRLDDGSRLAGASDRVNQAVAFAVLNEIENRLLVLARYEVCHDSLSLFS